MLQAALTLLEAPEVVGALGGKSLHDVDAVEPLLAEPHLGAALTGRRMRGCRRLLRERRRGAAQDADTPRWRYPHGAMRPPR